MADPDEKQTEQLSRLREAAKDWLEADGFYRATIKFGEKDYAKVLAVSGDVVDKALGLVSVLTPLLTEMPRADDMELGFRAVLQLASDEARGQIWESIDEVFTRCVTELSVKEWAEISGNADAGKFNANASYEERLAFIKGRLPLNLVLRVVLGVAAHLGNL